MLRCVSLKCDSIRDIIAIVVRIDQSVMRYREKDRPLLQMLVGRMEGEAQAAFFCSEQHAVAAVLHKYGFQLGKMAVDQIRGQGGAVRATCAYASNWLKKNGYNA